MNTEGQFYVRFRKCGYLRTESSPVFLSPFIQDTFCLPRMPASSKDALSVPYSILSG